MKQFTINIPVGDGKQLEVNVTFENGIYRAESKDYFDNLLWAREKVIISANNLEELIEKLGKELKNKWQEHIQVKEKKEWYIPRRKLFNPEGDDNLQERRVIKWNTTGIFNLNNVKYWRAKQLYNVMIWNFWIPEKVKWLPEDAKQYLEVLTDAERRTYDGIISFLTFLDSIQTMNLPNINDYITAPEINLILAIQTYQEAIHSQSYATILETVVPAEKRDKVYYFWRDDEYLLERNKFIWWIYQDFIDNPTDRNFFRTVIWNYLLESIYFYNGFAFFDTMADLGKMVASQRMINYIRRDELTHVTLFANLIKDLKREFPDMFDEDLVYEMFKQAVDWEIRWSTHIIGDWIMGMNEETIDKYTKWLANERLNLIWLKPLYPEYTENPYKHLERLWDHNLEKWNFFESTVTNYTQASALKGDWNF